LVGLNAITGLLNQYKPILLLPTSEFDKISSSRNKERLSDYPNHPPSTHAGWGTGSWPATALYDGAQRGGHFCPRLSASGERCRPAEWAGGSALTPGGKDIHIVGGWSRDPRRGAVPFNFKWTGFEVIDQPGNPCTCTLAMANLLLYYKSCYTQIIKEDSPSWPPHSLSGLTPKRASASPAWLAANAFPRRK
jgi:hypothetical protein